MTSLLYVPLMMRADDTMVAVTPLHAAVAAEAVLAIPEVDITRTLIVKIENFALYWLTRTVIVSHFSEILECFKHFRKTT